MQRASYLASFATHDEFQVEWTEDDAVVPPDNFVQALDDLAGSSEDSGPDVTDGTGLDDRGASANPVVTVEEPEVAQPDMSAA